MRLLIAILSIIAFVPNAFAHSQGHAHFSVEALFMHMLTHSYHIAIFTGLTFLLILLHVSLRFIIKQKK